MNLHTLCHIDDIPENSSKGFLLGELSLFAVKKNNLVSIYLNSCPHLGVPLEWIPDQFLDDEGVYIQCATHGALFNIESGQCVSGPCMHEFLKEIPFHIKDGKIILSLDNPKSL